MDKSSVITLRPRQDGWRFPDDFFVNENIRISINISLKFVPKGAINNIPSLVQIMAWRRPGDKLLSEPMMVSLLTYICVTRPQWVIRRWDRYCTRGWWAVRNCPSAVALMTCGKKYILNEESFWKLYATFNHKYFISRLDLKNSQKNSILL